MVSSVGPGIYMRESSVSLQKKNTEEAAIGGCGRN
jgi:hypothetical protein